MTQLVVYGAKAALPGGRTAEHVRLTIDTESGVIRELDAGVDIPSTSEENVLKADLVVPGFVDIHNHGLGGADDALHFWQNPEFSQQRLPALGTTSFLATILWPRDHQDVMDQVVSQLLPRLQQIGHGAVLEGLHVEGPLVNDLGALPAMATDMSVETLDAWIASLPPRALKMMTISPHIEAKYNYDRLRCLLKWNVRPALGHDKVASEAEILAALSCSPKERMHITHMYNVSSFHHRLPGLVNVGLVEKFPNLPQYTDLQPPTVELIGDFAHVHPIALQTALSCRHFSNVAFVSDSISEPIPGKQIHYCGRKLEVSADAKRVVLSGGDTLAGSCLSLLQTFRNLVDVLGIPVGEASAMLSETPARVARIDQVGCIRTGHRGDLLLLDKTFDLLHCVVAGRVVYSRDGKC